MSISGEIRFMIISKRYSESWVDLEIDLEPTQIIKKGQCIATNIKAPKNIWIYSVKFCNNSFAEQLWYLLNKLQQGSKFFSSKDDIYENVSIDFFIRSENGQLGYTICKDALKKIAELKLDINFHILSFGEVS